MTRFARLILTQTEACVFTERPATEGEHRSLGHPTGAALLGWAAAKAPYADMHDPYAAFHSGQVRFSNALPVAPSGCPAYPMPQILMEPKHTGGGVEGGMLKPDPARIGRPPEDNAPQHETLGRVFLTLAGEVLRPDFGARLRTEIEAGRAKTGALFGYDHLKPDAEPRFVATIEAEDGALTDKDWQRLRAAFEGKTLRLGRAAGTYYGGEFRCEWNEAGASPWPTGTLAQGDTLVRVWALSDLALTDAHGAPCFRPEAAMLGLPPGGRFDGGASAISLRRYAPWNRHLRRRDVERQVIEAGSVLTFRYPHGAPHSVMTALAGWGREAGLGRLYLQPPLLTGKPPPPLLQDHHPVLDPNAPAVASARETNDADPPTPDPGYAADLIAWARRVPA